jgi:hypothetical protein
MATKSDINKSTCVLSALVLTWSGFAPGIRIQCENVKYQAQAIGYSKASEDPRQVCAERAKTHIQVLRNLLVGKAAQDKFNDARLLRRDRQSARQLRPFRGIQR